MIMRPLIIKSGGQTGADQAGLEAAKQCGIMTGGWMPRGALTELGPTPELLERYGLKEHPSPQYRPRTRLNVKETDGTVWFGKTGSPGYKCTKRACEDYKKPFWWIDDAKRLQKFIEEFRIRALNVAGNRESSNPGIYYRTCAIIIEAFHG